MVETINENNKKKSGRKKKYSTEELEIILDKYFANNIVSGNISASKIAQYAKEHLGYEDMHYKHFTRDSKIKEHIDKLNSDNIDIECSNNNMHLIEFDLEKALKLYKKNDKMFQVTLRSFQHRYNYARNQLYNYEKEIVNLKQELASIKQINKELVDKNKELRKKSSLLTESNSNLKRLKKLDRKLVLFDELVDKGKISEDNYDTIIYILKSCNLIDSEDILPLEHIMENDQASLNSEDNEEDEVECGFEEDDEVEDHMLKFLSKYDE